MSVELYVQVISFFISFTTSFVSSIVWSTDSVNNIFQVMQSDTFQAVKFTQWKYLEPRG